AVDQLAGEGFIQVLRSDLRGDATPVFAAVGPMQFDVASHRLETEFNAPVKLDRLSYSVVRRLADPDQRTIVDAGRRSEVLTRTDGTDLALFEDGMALRILQRQHPELALESLLAEGSEDSEEVACTRCSETGDTSAQGFPLVLRYWVLLPVWAFTCVRAVAASGAASAVFARAMQLSMLCSARLSRTSGIALGAMDRLVTPRPTSTSASSGSAAASPHTPTAFPAMVPESAVAAISSNSAR